MYALNIYTMKKVLFIGIIFLLVGCGVDKPQEIVEAEKNLPKKIDFNFDVKPILSDKCFICHGPDQANLKANLRLDIEEDATSLLGDDRNRAAIVPGKLNKSHVYLRIISDDPDFVMPPPEANLALTPKEKATITKWIEQGAKYKPHWAFIPANDMEIPKVNDQLWIRNPIDNFVLKSLEDKRLNPNIEAEKEVLLRRITFDLTGLPPTIEEIDNFLDDQSEDAYEKVVVKLMNSPHYGERMALEWLDVSRYADSHGYSQDGYRRMWPWRDWVIKSFNNNMPFDQFITWQIAGDKFPNATKEQRMATAFLRNQKLNSEGGIVQEEYLVEYAADRTETISTAFLGLTMQCAKCHDHKYDLLSQKEYYQLFSFFNSVNESGLVQKDYNSGPQVLLTSKETDEKIEFINTEIQKNEEKILQYLSSLNSIPSQNPKIDLKRNLQVDLVFESKINGKIKNLAKPGESFLLHGEGLLKDGVHGKSLKFSGFDILSIKNKVLDFERSDEFSFSFWLNSNHDSGYMPVIFHLGGKNESYKGYEIAILNGRPTMRLVNQLPANLISVSTKNEVVKNEWNHFAFVYDGSGKANGITIYVNGKKDLPQILFDQLTKSISSDKNKNTIKIGSHQAYQVDVKGYGFIDDLKIYNRSLSEIEVISIFQQIKVDTAIFSNAQLKENYLLNSSKKYQKLKRSLKELKDEKNQIFDTIPTVMVMQDLDEPRPTFILDRGVYDAQLEEVKPGTPQSVYPFPEDFPKDRLGLAKWLVDKNNPLTARVIVNRYWQLFFGQGIVKTTEDFGNQGSLPTHPKLLDYLTYNFVESGWDVKKLHKSIVMSATYRQSSRVLLKQRQEDPENVLLARGPSMRLQAEIIRDCALASSGLLVNKIGGPSVKPYQPKGLWLEKNNSSLVLTSYKADSGDKLYRRSLYTFWRRTSPPPSMIMFDAPTRSYCTVRRQKTNTPLQALVLLNDPQFFEAARVLAARVIENKKSVEQQIVLAYRLLTALKPDNEVVDMLSKLFKEQQSYFNKNKDLTRQLATVGNYPINDQLSLVDVSAMSVVCNTIMSFDETIVKR